MTDKRKTGGFASMDPARQREIAASGGKAAHVKGTAHRFTSEEARAAGAKGGAAVSKNREHMRAIGRIGGVNKGKPFLARTRADAQVVASIKGGEPNHSYRSLQQDMLENGNHTPVSLETNEVLETDPETFDDDIA